LTDSEKQTMSPVEEERPAKLDPETFELRSQPARAIRFRRGAIVGVAAVGSASLVAIGWMALKPQLPRQANQVSDLSQPLAKPASDALAGLPANYGDAPRLGPPLPGDLGRPILRAQERAMAEKSSTGVDDAQARSQQHAAELKAARESGLLAQVSSNRTDAALSQGANGAPSREQGSPTADDGTTRKERFVQAQEDTPALNTHAVLPLASPNTLLAGTVIAASLITGLNSDLPGMVTAQVTQSVYDTVTGRILLVPQGSRLLGKYDSVVAFGQKRALVIWQRLILPNGSSVRLDNMPASDTSGYAGLADKVDFHTWSLLKGVGLATLLGVGSELTISGESDLVEAIRESSQTNVSRAGDQITQRNLGVQPTVTIRPGAPVRVLVSRDLVLAPAQEGTTSWPN
jgi:type IV secretion system protein VirB10